MRVLVCLWVREQKGTACGKARGEGKAGHCQLPPLAVRCLSSAALLLVAAVPLPPPPAAARAWQVFEGDGDLRWEVGNPDRVTRCRRARLQLSEVLAAAGASISGLATPSVPKPPPTMSRTTSVSAEGGHSSGAADAPAPPGTSEGGTGATSDAGGSGGGAVLPCPSIINGPRNAARGPLKLNGGHDTLPFQLEMTDVGRDGPPSGRYVPCTALSWLGLQLEWAGPFQSLDECVLACQAYFETGGREGAEKVAMRRDMLDLLL